MNGTFIDANGVKTYVIDRGKGPAIVLLHGASVAVDAYATWRLTIDALASEHRVIAFDQIGFGRTDMPRDGRYVNRLGRVDHALAVLDKMGVDRACFVGHSEGGFMAAKIAILRPAMAAGVVVVTSGATAPRLGGTLDDEWVAASGRAYNYSGGVDDEETFVRTNSSLIMVDDPEGEQLLRENYRRAKAAGQIEMFRNLPVEETDFRRYIALQEREIYPHLATLAAPMLLIWAANDPTVPIERGVALQKLAPKADLHILSNASHMVMIDRAKAFNRLLADWCRHRT